MRCGVVGFPAAHSLSPAIHRAAYATLGLDWSYDVHEVSPERFDAFVAGLDRREWRGLSVTMPHKRAVVRFGVPDDVVLRSGVANTLVLGDTPQQDAVHNTDVPGFLLACREHGLDRIDRVTILGNGATAVSALLAARDLGAGEVCFVVRDAVRAAPVLKLAADLGMDADLVSLAGPFPTTELVVSTVPVAAAAAHADEVADSADTVFDVVYDPWPTPLSQAGEQRGRRVLNGLDLLAAQAVDQVRLMTGGNVSFDLLRSAAAAELERRSAAGR